MDADSAIEDEQSTSLRQAPTRILDHAPASRPSAADEMQSVDIRPAKRLERTPRVFVTRHLMPSVEDRMRELFDVRLNLRDTSTRAQLIAAMQDYDVLVPTVTDRIDAEMIAQAGENLGLIANFGAGTEHLDLPRPRATSSGSPMAGCSPMTRPTLQWRGSSGFRGEFAKASS